jgi:geranylgeranyl diphosphate synthase type II
VDLNRVIKEVDAALDRCLPAENTFPAEIHRAVRYSVFAGGKRLRPLLTIAAAEVFGVAPERAMPAACAIELVHTYSLIHDDLPALDDDDFRRGRPSNHRVFGEAMAILAGDALLTRAFELLATEAAREFPPETAVRLAAELGRAAGTAGMIGGQVVDILSEGKQVSPEVLDYIHRHKTGALFSCCIRSGAIMGGASDEQLSALTRFAENIGLAFQVVDDILDITGDEKKLGKKTGADKEKKKATYPALHGLAKARETADKLYEQALADLAPFGDSAQTLRSLARLLIQRET